MRTGSILSSVVVAVGLLFPAAGAVAAEDAEVASGYRTIYLVRHGEYDHDDRRDPTVGKGLVPLGVAQARLVGARLRALPVDVTSLHSSTMTRARQTALLIGEEFENLDLQVSPMLSECTPPTSPKNITATLESSDLKACGKRLDQVFETYFRPSVDGDRNDVIVCHGNMIRYLVMKVLGVDEKRWYTMSIANCSVTVVTVTPGGAMSLLAFSDTGHLPPNLTTRTFPSVKRDLEVPAGEVSAEPPQVDLEE